MCVRACVCVCVKMRKTFGELVLSRDGYSQDFVMCVRACGTHVRTHARTHAYAHTHPRTRAHTYRVNNLLGCEFEFDLESQPIIAVHTYALASARHHPQVLKIIVA